MTSRNPWRRTHADLVAIGWLLVISIIIGLALGTAIAHAAPTAGEQFAADHAADICMALDEHPTVPGVITVLSVIEDRGLSPMESGVALGASVAWVCPIHRSLLNAFVARYGSRQVSA